MAIIIGYVVLGYPDDNLNGLLSLKSDHWSYESEWRLIVELDETIGTGFRDSRGLPINLVRVPNEAVVAVFTLSGHPLTASRRWVVGWLTRTIGTGPASHQARGFLRTLRL